MKKLFVLFIIFSFNIQAQTHTQALDFEFDYAQFAYDSTSNYVEFYYSFNQATMDVQQINSKPTINGILKIFLYDTVKGDTIINNQWKLDYADGVDSNMNKQIMVGTLSFVIPKGNYKCEVVGIDVNNEQNSRTISELINISPLTTGGMSISDIQLASRIIQDSENHNSIFYKNTYEVIPLPSLVFSISQPVLFFYTELYNLIPDSISNTEIKLLGSIFDNNGKQLIEKVKNINTTADSRVEVGSFILSSYPSGTYTLFIAIVDSIRNRGFSSSKKFFIYNPSVQVTENTELSGSSTLGTSFGSMSEEELDDIYDKSKYLATTAEEQKYSKISNVEGKREFLNEFWKSKELDLSSPITYTLKTYMQKVEVCNSRFKSMGKPGWKTDRGRVFLLYGEPSETDRYPNETETKPYEIWRYTEIEGGVEFVFADITGFSDYTLVHSTKRGELRDDNWSRRILVR